MSRVIGLAGYAGAGKSTIAKQLCEQHGFTLIKFAGPLKDMLRAVGMTEAELEGDLKQTPSDLFCNHTPRHVMQSLGTEWGRKIIGADFWVNCWKRRVREALSLDASVVVDDVRFPNEIEAVKGFGAMIWVQRPKFGPLDGHASENSISSQDMPVLHNDQEDTDHLGDNALELALVNGYA
jgi:predicted kinase